MRRIVPIILWTSAISLISGCSSGEKVISKEEYYENGQIKSRVGYRIRDGAEVLWGESIAYYPNGQIEHRSVFAQGKRHGPFESFYEDGKPKSAGTYAYGKFDGEWTEWDQEGNMKKKVYKNGEEVRTP